MNIAELIKAELEKVFEGVEATEEQQLQMQTILESVAGAVVSEAKTALESELRAAHSAELSTLAENVDKYLEYTISTWKDENQVALESGAKVELAESALSSIRGALQEHSLTVADTDVAEKHEATIADLTAQLSEANAQLDEHRKASELDQRDAIIAEATAGLTDVDSERFAVLIEGVEFSSAEEFSKKVDVIKGIHFKSRQVQENVSDPSKGQPIVEGKKSFSLAQL